MTRSIITIPKPTPHLVSTNDSINEPADSRSTEYYRYNDVLNDVVDDDYNNQDNDGGRPQLNYDDGLSMDTMDNISVTSASQLLPITTTTINCINTCNSSSSISISRFKVFKDKYLAPASPERASGKWMLINAFCLVWSLSLGVYIMLLYLYYDEFESEQDDDGIHNPASRESTTDYLMWSLFTSLVWITEVGLRISFPAVDTIIKVVNTSKSNNNLEAATTTATGESIRSIITVETIVEHRNKKQITIILLELVLAAYFVMQTIQDCYKHRKTHHHRYQNDDENLDLYENYYDYYDNDKDARAGGIVVYSILEQEVDVWVSVFAYAYMTYETYQGYYKTTSTKYNIQRSLTNLTNNGTTMGDPPPHYQNNPLSSSLIVHNNNSYINNNFDFDDDDFDDEGLRVDNNNDDSGGVGGGGEHGNKNKNKKHKIRLLSSYNHNHKKKKIAAALNMVETTQASSIMINSNSNSTSEQHILKYDTTSDNNDIINKEEEEHEDKNKVVSSVRTTTSIRITKETITAARIAAINNASNDDNDNDHNYDHNSNSNNNNDLFYNHRHHYDNDQQQQQQQQPDEGGNEDDVDVDVDVEDVNVNVNFDVDKNNKEDEDKGNTALLREVNVPVAKAENGNDDDDDDDDSDNNYTLPVHLQTTV
jgi:heme/copper-type cytochrome/quinol oxidase subunit 2